MQHLAKPAKILRIALTPHLPSNPSGALSPHHHYAPVDLHLQLSRTKSDTPQHWCSNSVANSRFPNAAWASDLVETQCYFAKYRLCAHSRTQGQSARCERWARNEGWISFDEYDDQHMKWTE